MYLTRLRLDPRSAQARRDLSDAYQMHRTLARAFVADETSAPPRFLWRLEMGAQAWAEPVVLVQAETTADWRALQALPNYLHGEVEAKALAPELMLQPAQRYRFRLLANPTVTREGKRLGLVGESEQLAWLARQGQQHGFDIESALVTATDVANLRKGDMRISLRRACFEGILQVREPDALIPAWTAGIGPAKAFGCGLLSMARG